MISTTLQMKMTGSTTAPESPPAESTSLEKLAKDLRSGRSEALELFVHRTEKTCFKLAYSILKDRDLSRDALQDTYLTVYRKIGQLQDNKAIKSWLFRIVTHSCHDILRKRKNEVETDLEERQDLLASPPTIGTSDPSGTVPRRDHIRSTFQELPEIDREVIALREVCSLSYQEMSHALRIPLGTVRSRLAKARKRFIDAYTKEQKS